MQYYCKVISLLIILFFVFIICSFIERNVHFRSKPKKKVRVPYFNNHKSLVNNPSSKLILQTVQIYKFESINF